MVSSFSRLGKLSLVLSGLAIRFVGTSTSIFNQVILQSSDPKTKTNKNK